MKQSTQQKVVQVRPTAPRELPKNNFYEFNADARGQKMSTNVAPIPSKKAHSAKAMTLNPAIKTTGPKHQSNFKPQPAQGHKVQKRPSVQSSMVSPSLKMNQPSNYDEEYPVII